MWMGEVNRISDNFANNILKTLDGRGGSVVTDSYRLSKGDIALLSDYPVKSYSFPRPWSRIIPLGGRDSPVSHNGIELYSKFINDLLANDITHL